MRPPRPITVLLLVTAVLLPGCESTNSTATLDTAISAYDHGRYDEAYRDGARLGGSLRDEGAYVAGLSAYRLGRTDDARTMFEIAASSRDEQTKGRAKAMLGVLETNAGRESDGAESFKQAALLLDGQNKRNAALAAAEAYQRAGRPDLARTWRGIAEDEDPEWLNSTDSAATTVASTGRSTYTVQIGSFARRANADRAASGVTTRSRDLGLGAPRVVRRETGRGSRYIVQVGSFNSKAAAESAGGRLGAGRYYVTFAAP